MLSHLHPATVVLCFPSGTSLTGIFAYCSSWLSMCSNRACRSSSAQSQMIGFNLGLGRSSEGDVSFGDTIGIVSSGTNAITEFAQVASLILIWILISFHSPPNMPLLTSRDQMGSYNNNDDGPMKCFNGPKTYQLGWFRSHYDDTITMYGNAWKAYNLSQSFNVDKFTILNFDFTLTEEAEGHAICLEEDLIEDTFSGNQRRCYMIAG
jgi:hypothetical protein